MAPPIKSQVSRYQQQQLRQINYFSEMADAYQKSSDSIALRKEIWEKQQILNYQSEYARLRDQVENSVTARENQDNITRRIEHLKTL